MQFLVSGAELSLDDTVPFWVYKITCSSTLPSYQNPPLFPKVGSDIAQNFTNQGDSHVFFTQHRFSDFEWLREHLTEAFLGLILPPIPDKDAVGTFDKVASIAKNPEKEHARDSPITSKRIRRLQIFLASLSKVPALLESEYVKAFFTMEEPEWVRFKVSVKQRNGKFGERLLAKGRGIFKKITNTKISVFPHDSELGQIRAQHLDLSIQLHASATAITELLKKALFPTNINSTVQETCTVLADRPIHLPLYFNDHRVADPGHPGSVGTVRHIQGSTMWIELESGIQRHSAEALSSPSDGFIDPVLLAFDELCTQIDSFLSYSSVNNAHQALAAAADSCWFWSRYAFSVVCTVDALAEVETNRFNVQKDFEKAQEGSKKDTLKAEVDAFEAHFAEGVALFKRDYAEIFRPEFKQAITLIAEQTASSAATLLVDDQWNERLTIANGALKTRFDIPQEVEDDLRALAAAPAAEAPQAQNYSPTVPAKPSEPPVPAALASTPDVIPSAPPPQEEPTPPAAAAAPDSSAPISPKPSMGSEHAPEPSLDAPPPVVPSSTDE